MPTSKAELAFFPLRAKLLIPLVTTPPFSDADATTIPPGHIQKVYTPLPFFKCTACLYSAAPNAG